MAQNKNALIRYKTIDQCLQNNQRPWTLEDLIDACSDALYEYEGRDVNVSKRTVQLDIQLMRSDKLGYNAPIIVYERKYYRYKNPDFSITNIPLTANDMNILTETVQMLKQFKDFSLFNELGGIIQRLEDKVYTQKENSKAIIHLDKNESLKGLQHLDPLYHAIGKRLCLRINYQSFKARESSNMDFHPYILKEYNNRWFLVGRKIINGPILTLALDRILSFDYNLALTYDDGNFDGETYYHNTIGVTVFNNKNLRETTLKIASSNAPYVLTKPFHHTQQLIEKLPDGSIIISLKVDHNYEFTRLLLGYGESLEVLSPSSLRRNIARKLKQAYHRYE